MYRELHDALSHAAEAMHARDRLRVQREATAARLGAENRRHAELRAKLEAERKDVARLETLSLARMLASIAGRLEPTLEEERRQADVAELSFVEQTRLVEALTMELAEIDRRIAALGDVDELHHRAMDAKARALIERGDEHGRLVLELSQRYAHLSAMGVELREALEHGQALATALASAARTLHQAVSIGTTDIWIGGSLTTADKHYVLDQASRHMQQASLLFELYRKELADVGRGLAPRAPFLAAGASPSRGDRLMEHLFGVFANLDVQARIKATARGVAFVCHEVHQSLEELRRAYDEGHREWQAVRTRLVAAIAAG